MTPTWRAPKEWQEHANCSGDKRYRMPPEKLSESDMGTISAGCGACHVRVECIKAICAPQVLMKIRRRDSTEPFYTTGVWCAGQYIPEPYLDDSDEVAELRLVQASEVRANLLESLPAEIAKRGDF